MSTQSIETPKPTATTAAEPAMLTPEAFVEQLRTLRQQLADVMPLTPQQQHELRRLTRVPNEQLQASINVISFSGKVSQALGQPAEQVRQLFEEANRWTVAEAELQSMLKGLAGANLIRRQKATLAAGVAYGVAKQLARDPENAELLPHVQEVKRLKKLGRRKANAPSPTEPTPTGEGKKQV